MTSKSISNPTGIQFKHSKLHDKGNLLLLKQGLCPQDTCRHGVVFLRPKLRGSLAGESTQLGVGDRILLLATQVDQYLEVADITQPSSNSPMQEPASKRYKSPAETVALV